MITVPKHISPSDLSRFIVDAIKEGLSASYPEIEVKRGSIYFFIPDDGRLLSPIVTVESGRDPVDHKEGANNFCHRGREWRIRATINTVNSPDPEGELESIRSALRKALFRSTTHDFSLIGFAEFEPSDTTLPRPGLPLCSVVLNLSATFFESTK